MFRTAFSPPTPLRTCACPSSDRKSTRLNSSHRCISYAVFCLKKKNLQKLDAMELAHFDQEVCHDADHSASSNVVGTLHSILGNHPSVHRFCPGSGRKQLVLAL